MADVTKEYTKGQDTSTGPGYGDGRNCLKFAGDRFKDEVLDTPPDIAVLSPWIVVKLQNVSGFEVTVGNRSSMTTHFEGSQSGYHPHAAVVSMEYGMSNGSDAKIEIVDEMGGTFATFFNRGLLKKPTSASTANVVLLNFGWVGTGKNGEIIRYPPKDTWTLHLWLINVDVNVSEGKVKYVLNCSDMMNLSLWLPQTVKYPNMSLKKAITSLLDEQEPKMDVAFLRKSKNGGPPQEWLFPAASDKQADENGNGGAKGEGPIQDWSSDNDTKLTIIQKWTAGFTTDNGKGQTQTCDPCRENPVLLIWEGVEEDQEEETSITKNHPCFLVNGGKCSNVLSFSPNINYIAAFFQFQNSGGLGPISSASYKGLSGVPGNDKQEVGQATAIPLTAAVIDTYQRDASKESSKANVEQVRANAVFEQSNVIEAELKIIGNPSRKFLDIRHLFNTTVSIIFINPFTIDKNTGPTPSLDDNLCGDWLAAPSINTILTSDRWRVRGTSHSIRDGKYVTTLSLFLQAAGVNFEEK